MKTPSASNGVEEAFGIIKIEEQTHRERERERERERRQSLKRIFRNSQATLAYNCC
jgi:hypothetical protein